MTNVGFHPNPVEREVMAIETDIAEAVPVLDVENLCVDIATSRGRVVRIVDKLSLSIYPGTCLGVVGESGSGKSVTLLSLFDLMLGVDVRVTTDRFRFAGQDVDPMDKRGIQRLLRHEVAVVFQDPMTSLNPVMRIGEQIAEVVRQQGERSAAQIHERVVELLEMVEIPSAADRVRNYPHEFSGGQRQRIMIAMAMAKEPRLIIADEPTTALDVTTQAQVLRIMREAQQATGAATIFVSHDLGVISHLADKVAVFYGGRLAEAGPAAGLFGRPLHPYTASLLRSTLPLRRTLPRLLTLPGEPPDPRARPSGCVFHPRCPVGAGREICRTTEPKAVTFGERSSFCHFPEETAGILTKFATDDAAAVSRRRIAGDDEIVIETIDLRKDYGSRLRFLSGARNVTPAVDGVSLKVPAGRTVALVGESGCGKTTTAKMIGRLIDPTSGTIRFRGLDYAAMTKADIARFRRKVQFVFQDPYASMNPRMPIGMIMAEPLETHRMGNKIEREERVHQLLQRVGLRRSDAGKFPHQFSGGQRQRIAIARALAPKPDLLILDEPVSALDVSVQSQILNLLKDLQDEMSMTMIFISHDLSVVRQVADDVVVMYRGQVVERGTAAQIIAAPTHAYTRELLGSVLTLDDTVSQGLEHLPTQDSMGQGASSSAY